MTTSAKPCASSSLSSSTCIGITTVHIPAPITETAKAAISRRYSECRKGPSSRKPSTYDSRSRAAMRVSSRTMTDGATVANPQVVCMRLSASFGTVLSDTDAKAGGIAKTLNQRVNAGS